MKTTFDRNTKVAISYETPNGLRQVKFDNIETIHDLGKDWIRFCKDYNIEPNSIRGIIEVVDKDVAEN